MARRSNPDPAFAVPLRTGDPTGCATGRGSPVSADSSITASTSSTTPSTGTTSPVLTITTSPGTICSTGTLSMAPSRLRWARAGARAISAESSRRARWPAASSRARPPDSMSAMIAAVRYSPSTSATAMARRAMRSTPTCRSSSARMTAHVSGTRATTAASAQITFAALDCPASASPPPQAIAAIWPAAR